MPRRHRFGQALGERTKAENNSGLIVLPIDVTVDEPDEVRRQTLEAASCRFAPPGKSGWKPLLLLLRARSPVMMPLSASLDFSGGTSSALSVQRFGALAQRTARRPSLPSKT